MQPPKKYGRIFNERSARPQQARCFRLLPSVYMIIVCDRTPTARKIRGWLGCDHDRLDAETWVCVRRSSRSAIDPPLLNFSRTDECNDDSSRPLCSIDARPETRFLEPLLPHHVRYADECRERFEAALAARSRTLPFRGGASGFSCVRGGLPVMRCSAACRYPPRGSAMCYHPYARRTGRLEHLMMIWDAPALGIRK